MAHRDDLLAFCTELLQPERFQDAAVNGLQVAGHPEIRRLATSVSATQRSIDEAVSWGAELLLVHHGLLWGQRLGPLVGPTRERLRALLVGDLNLVGYHLPLDAHPEIGNNTLLARALGLTVREPFASVGAQPIGVVAEPTHPLAIAELAERLRLATAREPTVLDGGAFEVRRVGVLTGSGSGALDEALAARCDVMITGDARESTMALAREVGVTVLAGGHEATERLGVQALGERLARQFGLETRFLPDPNPI